VKEKKVGKKCHHTLLALTCMSHTSKDSVLISCNGYGGAESCVRGGTTSHIKEKCRKKREKNATVAYLFVCIFTAFHDYVSV